MKTAILLVNLGTPLSPNSEDVYRYLIEFLTDRRVIDLPWLKRQLLVRGVIVPSRYKESAKAYRQIWTKEGSPLLVYGRKVQHLLQKSLGDQYQVELAMRYQEPNLQETLNRIMRSSIDHLVILPLFPQYASATTGSVYERIQQIISGYPVIPKMTFINQFATHPGLIDAFCAIAKEHHPEKYDHILFSFHGLPQKHIKKADGRGYCLGSKNCCAKIDQNNAHCYSAQCFATAEAIAKQLQLPENKHSLCFQSRLGKDPWLEPFTSEVIANLAKTGKKRVLVICPAFVCDCLETTYEIGIEYAHAFKQAGGEHLELVRGLNDHPEWIRALREIVLH